MNLAAFPVSQAGCSFCRGHWKECHEIVFVVLHLFTNKANKYTIYRIPESEKLFSEKLFKATVCCETVVG